MAALNQSASSALAELLRNNPELTVNGDVSGSYEDADPLEHYEQCAVVDWARAHENVYPELRLLHSTPNGGYRHPATGAAMKAEGALAGWPDLELNVARRCFDGATYHSLFIEMKRIGGRLRPEQLVILEDLRSFGHQALCCYGAREAIAAIEHYLELEKW